MHALVAVVMERMFNSNGSENGFTAEQEEFMRIHEEGYDLYIDTNYVRWLRFNYPKVNTCMQDAPAESGSILDQLSYSCLKKANEVEFCDNLSRICLKKKSCSRTFNGENTCAI